MDLPPIVAQPPPDLEALRAASRRNLSCPHCQKFIPLMGRCRAIRHPFAEKLQERSFAITAGWCLFLLFCMILMLFAAPDFVLGRAAGWWVFFFPALPPVTIYFVVRLFPRYRPTECPFCGHRELQKLLWRRTK